MSDFIKHLKEARRGSMRAIGFGAASRTSTPPMLMVGSIAHLDGDMIRLAISAGIDAILFDINDPAGHASAISSAFPPDTKLPWGAYVPKADAESMAKLTEAGCDFVVLDSESAARVLGDDDVGKLLEVTGPVEDGTLRSISALSVDALFGGKDRQSGPLTIGQLLLYHRLTGFSGKPAVLMAPLDSEELGPLRDAGVGAVIVEVSGKDAEARLNEVREAIRKLPLEKKRKSKAEETSALLPSSASVDDIDSEY